MTSDTKDTQTHIQGHMAYINVFSKYLNFAMHKIGWQIIVCGAQKQITDKVWDVCRGKGEVKKGSLKSCYLYWLLKERGKLL